MLQDVGDRMQRRAQGSQARRHGRVGLLVADLLCLYREQPREVEIGGSPWSVPVPPGALLRLALACANCRVVLHRLPGSRYPRTGRGLAKPRLASALLISSMSKGVVLNTFGSTSLP